MKTKPTNLAEGTLYCHYYVINCKHILKNSFCCLMNMNKSLCFYYYCKYQQWMTKIHEIP